MYLTRLRLDPRSAQARGDLADPYDMHRTLVRAFVRDAEQTPPRILWRAEPAAAWSEPVVLVQAQQLANWSVIEALPNYLKGDAETRDISPENWLGDEQRYRFRLFANPTVTREEFRNQGRVTDLITTNKLTDDLGLPPLNPAEDRVMLCGSPGLLVDMKHILEERGFKEGNTSTPGDYVVERAFAEK